jgi:glutamyl-Q tRNA(Asp) synthetase
MTPQTSTSGAGYRGRFAPSPTGPLHFGSLVAAVGSFLEARCRGGEWLVRIEDLDPPREVPGAADQILRTLEAYGLHWDGEVVYQSGRSEVYEAALARLAALDAVYPCGCSRREIAEASAPRGMYPGTCRGGLPPGRRPRATRVRVGATVAGFRDRLHGTVVQDLGAAVGDFVVVRADGLTAYQLAVVVDDAAQQISAVVRGSDLLDSTGRQLLLQRLLDLPSLEYAHLPVVTNSAGEKLSKQTGAQPLQSRDAPAQLKRALEFLGHCPPAELRGADVGAVLEWALECWRLDDVPRGRPRPASGGDR